MGVIMICVCVYSLITEVSSMYTGLLQEVPELYLESSGSSSYHFLHKTVQEFMAALYVSSLHPDERYKIVVTSFDKGSMRMVMRFMAGLTKFQTEDDMRCILALQNLNGQENRFERFHWLFEAHDPVLVQSRFRGNMDGKLEWYLTMDPYDCYVLGYYIANTRRPWDLNLVGCCINEECVKILTVVENGRALDYIRSICLPSSINLGDQGAKVLGELYKIHSAWGHQTFCHLCFEVIYVIR